MILSKFMKDIRNILIVLFFIQILLCFTPAIVTKKCPICGNTFSSRVAGSAYQAGTRLDLKAYGAIDSPRLLPICPNDGFIFFKEEFSLFEIIQLRYVVLSEDYHDWIKNKPIYYRIAKLKEAVFYSQFDIGFSYVQASWEVDSDKEECLQMLNCALAHLENYVLQDNKKETEKLETAKLLIGEILRRKGKFDLAQNYFSELQHQPEFQTDRYSPIIKQQLLLISSKDDLPHEIQSH